jgi:hypothetical protein
LPSRDDIRLTQEAGILAGLWFAAPGRHLGHELIAAGLLVLAGVTDRDQLEQAVRLATSAARAACKGTTQADREQLPAGQERTRAIITART